MKKTIYFFFFIIILLLGILYRNTITSFVVDIFFPDHKIVVEQDAIYQKQNYAFFLETTDDFIIKNPMQALNVLYTILDSGWNSFTFYCDLSYIGCIDGVKDVFSNDILLSGINASIHPYNSYKNIELQIKGQDELIININRLYTKEQINYLNSKVDNLYNSLIKDDMTTRQKILAFHDYIANTTIYDEDYKKEDRNSNNAYGLFTNGKAICSGYADAMQLFLIKMNLPNYKLTSENHIWNYVYLDGSWLHLDVSWDDPVTSSGKNKVIYDYFLISDNKIKSYNDGEHNYNNMFIIKKES